MCIKKEKEQSGKSATGRASCNFEYSGQGKPLRWTFEQKLRGVNGNEEYRYLGQRVLQTKATELKSLLGGKKTGVLEERQGDQCDWSSARGDK